MTPRMTNPALLLPDALEAALALSASTAKGDLPRGLSNSCCCERARSTAAASASTCTPRGLERDGETDERLHAVAAWRDTAYFREAERAALALGRVRHPPQRPPGPGARRRLGRGGPPLRRGRTGVVARDDRRDQPLQPDERGDAPGGRVGAAARLKGRRVQGGAQPENVAGEFPVLVEREGLALGDHLDAHVVGAGVVVRAHPAATVSASPQGITASIRRSLPPPSMSSSPKPKVRRFCV